MSNNIITIEQLYKTQLKGILEPLFKQYKAELPKNTPTWQRDINFDEWLFQNLEVLGQAVYENIGDFYGDCDTAVKELLVD